MKKVVQSRDTACLQPTLDVFHHEDRQRLRGHCHTRALSILRARPGGAEGGAHTREAIAYLSLAIFAAGRRAPPVPGAPILCGVCGSKGSLCHGGSVVQGERLSLKPFLGAWGGQMRMCLLSPHTQATRRAPGAGCLRVDERGLLVLAPSHLQPFGDQPLDPPLPAPTLRCSCSAPAALPDATSPGWAPHVPQPVPPGQSRLPFCPSWCRGSVSSLVAPGLVHPCPDPFGHQDRCSKCWMRADTQDLAVPSLGRILMPPLFLQGVRQMSPCSLAPAVTGSWAGRRRPCSTSTLC